MVDQSIVLTCRDHEDIDNTINNWINDQNTITNYDVDVEYVPNVGIYVITIYGDFLETTTSTSTSTTSTTSTSTTSTSTSTTSTSTTSTSTTSTSTSTTSP